VLAIGRERVLAAEEQSFIVGQVSGRYLAAADWELEWVQTLYAVHAAALSRKLDGTPCGRTRPRARLRPVSVQMLVGAHRGRQGAGVRGCARFAGFWQVARGEYGRLRWQ
jgi:hypothetical protein